MLKVNGTTRQVAGFALVWAISLNAKGLSVDASVKRKPKRKR